MRQLRATALAGAALLLAAPSAHASFHLMKVVEVFGGTPAAPNAQYVIIQMYLGGQNQLNTHKITVYNATGTLTNTFTFTGAVGVGANQDKILIATPEAASFFSLSADLPMTAVLVKAGGKVCFDAIPEDCVAWGSWSGGTPGVGTPFNVSGGLLPGKATIRRLNISGGATTLESGDDTDHCDTDFVAGTPAPQNSAHVNGTIPPSSCGNSVIEGLEQCDDGDATDAGTCNADCSATIVIVDNVFADGFE
jgi:cysteine-rich repeat protein